MILENSYFPTFAAIKWKFLNLNIFNKIKKLKSYNFLKPF